jgi:predicted transcriptional regulator
MDNLQHQVNARVEAFVAEITELARAAAYQALSAGLDTPIAGGRGAAVAIRGRKGGKRTAVEIAQMADAFLAHVAANPGQRMEHIAKELGLETPELTLPVRKLLADGKLRVEGQKRATQYYPADGSGSAKTTRAAKGTGVKVKRGRGRPKKKAA